MSAANDGRGGLRRELRFWEAIALSIGIMAPTAAMALNGEGVAAHVGQAVPLAFLISAILVFLVMGIGFLAFNLVVWRIIRPSRFSEEKLTTYECGIDPVGEGWSQSQIRYYIYAFLFVIFDVESVFLFPWATIFERLGYQAVVEMGIFVLILALGLLYAYRKKVLQWA